jgi:hypothetical protein
MHESIANSKPLNHERDRVRELIPDYLRESAVNLISFMEEYYNYLNRENFASYELDHVISENDIDTTSAKYLDSIQSEIAKIVPNSSVMDRTTLYKRIVHYYRIKGTPESVEVFFQMMFDTIVEIFYPGDHLLKLSAGDYSETTNLWSDKSGFLSSTDKIQDGEFWQKYSYQIKSEITSQRWFDAFSRLVHPAGMKLFALVIVTASFRNKWFDKLNYESTISNPEGWLNDLRPPSLGYHTPRYQLGWLQSSIAQFIESLAENLYDTTTAAGINLNRDRIVSLVTQLLVTSTITADKINRDHYYNRGYWDDVEPLANLGIASTTISELIDDAAAPQPSVDIDGFVDTNNYRGPDTDSVYLQPDGISRYKFA